MPAASVLEDAMRYMVPMTIMRPLAEGLALFAQYDSVPSVFPSFSEIISQPIKWLPVFFPDASRLNMGETAPHPRPPELMIPGGSAYKTLAEMRVSEQMVESKAGLLCSPFSCENGGYLPGYLLVKSLWRYAVSKSNKFYDTDFFLCFLRSFFYDDLGFVAVLLDPYTQRYESVNAILSYFHERLVHFFKRDLHADAERFESEVLAWEKLDQMGEDPRNHGLLRFFSDPHAAQLGYKRMQALLEDGDDIKDIDLMINRTIQRRGFMHIGKLKGVISVQQEHTQQWEENLADFDDYKTLSFSYNNLPVIKLPILSAAAEMKIPLWAILAESSHQLLDKSPRPNGFLRIYMSDRFELSEGRGDLDLFFSWDEMYRVAKISIADNTICHMFFDLGENEESRKMAINLLDNYDEEQELMGSISLNMLLGNSWMDTLIEPDAFLKMMNKIYLPLALRYVPRERVQQCIQDMSKHGMYEIMRRDGELMRAFALLGICTSLSPRRRVVSDWFEKFGMDIAGTIDSLCECAKLYKIPEISQTDDLVGCFI